MATKKPVAKVPIKKTVPAPASGKSGGKLAVKVAAKVAPAKKATTAALKKPVAPAATVKKPVPAKDTVTASKTKVAVKPTVKVLPILKPTKIILNTKKAPTPVAKTPMKKAPEKEVVAPKATAPAKKADTKSAVKAPKAVVKVTAKRAKDITITPTKATVLPKINTKSSRKYQPDFTKSVLDAPKHNPGAPITRYNDLDLTEFKELIQRKLNAAKKELNYLQGLITRKDALGGDDSDNRYMTMEDGSLSMEREQLSQMASRQITFVDHLEKALIRIENKTYGICRVTGKLIDKARLRAVPHATLSIEAKMGSNK